MVISVDKTFLSNVERGLRAPTLGTIDKIAQGLDVNLVYVFEGVGGEASLDASRAPSERPTDADCVSQP
ncbi:hypothetical protein B5F33_00740 [Collinsella sp. An2]|nr:hypothetical protein B5F33_00740 [Collinsella sp. An2]